MQSSITFAILSLTAAYLGIQQNLLAPLIVSGLCMIIAVLFSVLELTECTWVQYLYEEKKRCR
jgi:hypothetical protein